jgi:hypothetical protein
MAKHTGVAEILKDISQVKDFKERQDKLGQCANIQPLMQVLHATFHPEVQFLLPTGRPPFTPLAKSVDAQGAFYQQARTLYVFIKGLSPNVQQLRREVMFVQLLESVDRDDAEMLIGVKDKIMIYPGITYDLVEKTFPGLLPPEGKPVREDFTAQKAITMPPLNVDDMVLDLAEYQIVKEDVAPLKKTERKPCLFGCVSTQEDGLYSVSGLIHHKKTKHPKNG